MRSKFKDEHPFGETPHLQHSFLHLHLFIIEKRKAEAERIRQKYPDRIPVGFYLAVLYRVLSRLFELRRSFARRQIEQISQQSTRRSILCHRYAVVLLCHVSSSLSLPGKGSHCWAICLCHPQAHQVGTREGDLHLCRRSAAADGGIDECDI